MINRLEEARAAGDTLGGIVEIVVRGCPPGLGEPVFGKIDADLAGALMGIGTVKGVEIGAGFAAARMTGSACNDPISPEGFRTNHAGGILAGITSGGEIVIRVACKPIPSIARPQETIDSSGTPRRRHGRRQARRVGHPPDHPGLRGDGRDRTGGSSLTPEGDQGME